MTDPHRFAPLLPPTRRAVVAGLGATLAAGPFAAGAQEVEGPLDPRLNTEVVTFPVRKKTFKGLLVRLRAGAKRPCLLLLPDQHGLSPFFRQTARRYALDGFLVFVPDLLSQFNLVDETSDEGPNQLARISPAEHLLVFEAAADLLAKHPGGSGAVGVIGFVWGGTYALQFAIAGARVKAAVAYYPSLPALDRLVEIRVPVQFHWPENDPRSAPVVETMEKRLIAAGRSFEEWTYAGAAIGFASEPDSRRFDRAAADRAYDRSVFFLRRTLGG